MDASNLFSSVSYLFAIFLIASIAGMISERAGVINVAIEGYMIVGALVFSIVGTYVNSDGTNNLSQILAFVVVIVVCGLFSLLQSFASIRLKTNQIISGTAINLLAQGIGLYFATSGLFGGSTINIDSQYTRLAFDDKKIFSFYLIIAIIVAIIVGVYFTFTKIGKRHIAAGENPNALDAAGISVIKFRWGAAFVSGALAGLAGAIYAICVLSSKFNGSTRGFGFLALAIMIIGQWRTTYISAAAFLFALFFGLADQFAVTSIGSWAQTNSILLKVLPFIISLVVMVSVSKWSKPPKADGIPFDKSLR